MAAARHGGAARKPFDLAQDAELRARLYLANKLHDFDLAFSISDEQVKAWTVIYGEIDGGRFDWGRNEWIPFDG